MKQNQVVFIFLLINWTGLLVYSRKVLSSKEPKKIYNERFVDYTKSEREKGE